MWFFEFCCFWVFGCFIVLYGFVIGGVVFVLFDLGLVVVVLLVLLLFVVGGFLGVFSFVVGREWV